MDTYTASEATCQINELLEKVLIDRRHCRVVSGHGTAIVMPEDTYQNLVVTLELLSTPGLLENFNMMDIAQEAAAS